MTSTVFHLRHPPTHTHKWHPTTRTVDQGHSYLNQCSLPGAYSPYTFEKGVLKFSYSIYLLENSFKIVFAKSLIYFFSKKRNFPSLHCTTSASSLISSQLRFVKSKHTRKNLTRDISIALRNILPYPFKNYISLAHFYVVYFLKYFVNKLSYPPSMNSLINVDFGDVTTRARQVKLLLKNNK